MPRLLSSELPIIDVTVSIATLCETRSLKIGHSSSLLFRRDCKLTFSSIARDGRRRRALIHAIPGANGSCFAGRSANSTVPMTMKTITSLKCLWTP